MSILILLLIWFIVSIPVALFVGAIMGFSSEVDKIPAKPKQTNFAKGGVVPPRIYLVSGGCRDKSELFIKTNDNQEQL